ncbi:MAG: hypothetical protein LBI99_00955 [Propionibacteriaceae bacterium]|jgi:sulfofructosephosphate aldolase|nr:hypothetical protein [Propionibacteriaceae bacterium]
MTEPTLAAIALPGGGLAMVAMDQRESLATMVCQATGKRPEHQQLVDFKLAVAGALGPLASGFLIDAYHRPDAVAASLPPTCGLILAADALTQEEGGPVIETDLDESVLAEGADLFGAAALKLLVIWRRDGQREARVRLAASFIAAARALGVLSVLEPVVRPTDGEWATGSWDQDAAIREAARELSALHPSLTKVQVPLGGKGSPGEQFEASKALDAVIATPWVVLSQGVDPADYILAVEAACKAGASGFLAGRALWSDVVGRPDTLVGLNQTSVPRLERLVEIVDRHGRPWEQR